MSLGKLAYERDRAFEPNYHDGSPRPPWEELSDIAKDSWNHNPTDRRTK